jgi:hypothetical protein
MVQVGLGANQRRNGDEQQGERKMGRGHRLGMSVYRKSGEKGRGEGTENMISLQNFAIPPPASALDRLS